MNTTPIALGIPVLYDANDKHSDQEATTACKKPEVEEKIDSYVETFDLQKTVAAGGLVYTAVAAGETCSYMLRSDGAVDETRKKGIVSKTFPRPSADVAYIGIDAGSSCGTDLFLRSDGKVFQRGTWWNAVVEPPAGVKYIQVSCGMMHDYYLRDDGVIDRGRNGRFHQITPPAGKKYVMLAGGTDHSYFLRDDGVVERTRGWGSTHVAAGNDATDLAAGKFVSVGSSMVATKGRYYEGGAFHHFVIRADGAAVRMTWQGKDGGKTFLPPSGCTYTGCAVNEYSSYLLRSDGCVDREQFGKIQTTLNPPPGTSYVAVQSGRWSTYLLRSDGLVDRTTGGGKLDQSSLAPGEC